MDSNRIWMIVAAVVVAVALIWYFYPELTATQTESPPATAEPKK